MFDDLAMDHSSGLSFKIPNIHMIKEEIYGYRVEKNKNSLTWQIYRWIQPKEKKMEKILRES